MKTLFLDESGDHDLIKVDPLYPAFVFAECIEVPKAISDFKFKKKEENIAGLQLIDSVITPIGRKYLNKRNHYIDYEVIKAKYHRHKCGKYNGYGLVIFPKK
ncbi:MAG: hypothetical protein WC329_07415 [Candidatus Omnitrophota bacterium]|jgi:hypothetical protein